MNDEGDKLVNFVWGKQGADQTVHLCSLTITFAIHCLERILY